MSPSIFMVLVSPCLVSLCLFQSIYCFKRAPFNFCPTFTFKLIYSTHPYFPFIFLRKRWLFTHLICALVFLSPCLFFSKDDAFSVISPVSCACTSYVSSDLFQASREKCPHTHSVCPSCFRSPFLPRTH